MYDRFGEFDTCRELNEAAAGLKEEGDIESLYALAEENGIEKEDAKDYMDGCVQELCNVRMAAFGKLQVEGQELELKGILEDWLFCIKARIAEDDKVAEAVRRKGKSLKGCIGKLLKWSFENQMPVPADILKAAGVTAKCTLGIPGMGQAKKIINEYYLGKKV